MQRWLAIALLSVAAEAAVAQSAGPAPGADIAVTLERGTCERRCPVYQVTLHGDGRVIYRGRHWVRKTGPARARVKPEEVGRLVAQFEAADFFALNNVYGDDPSDCDERRQDAPRSTLTLAVQGQVKSVRHSVGCIGPVTSRLTELGNAIDRLANTSRWIK